MVIAMSSRYRKGAEIAATAVFAAAVLLATASAQPPPLEPGDSIEVRLLNNPELNEQAQIRPDGHISLPLVGDIEIAGKTIPDAVAMLEKSYGAEVRAPKVMIQVRSFAGQKVYVTGEVI